MKNNNTNTTHLQLVGKAEMSAIVSTEMMQNLYHIFHAIEKLSDKHPEAILGLAKVGLYISEDGMNLADCDREAFKLINQGG